MTTKPKASIIILTFNKLEYTRQCIESIYARTDEPEYEVIAVDNNSSDGTQAYLEEFSQAHPNFHPILNPVNEGFARGNNLGARVAVGNYLVFLNNDTVVTRGWLAGLIRHLEDPTVGMVGPVTNRSGNETRISVDYQDLKEMEGFAAAYTSQHAGQASEVPMLAFLCVAMRRAVFEQIGPLDERFGVGMFEDDDYALRVRNAGYKILNAEDVFVHHEGSASFSQMQLSEYWQLFDMNRQKFEQKWGVAWQPHLYRPALIRQQVRELIDNASWYVSIITDLQGRLAEMEARVSKVEEIYASTTWQIVESLWNASAYLAPSGSLRERILRRSSRSLLSLLRSIEKVWGRITAQQMNWYAFAFNNYQYARHAFAAPRLSRISCPSQAGLVSIVLPVYNGATYLREALDSVIQQTYHDFELIAVDDGSNDETPRILAEYTQREPRLRVLTQENQGLPRALSNGLALARGEYLTWTSDDNRLKTNFLEKIVDCLKRHPDWDMVYANQDIIGVDGEPLVNSTWFSGYQDPPGSERIILPSDPSELNVWANNYIGGAFMFRARVYYLIGDYSPWRFGTEDYDYWMRVNALLNLRHADFPDTIFEYRFHGESLTSRDEKLGITRNRIRLMTFEDFRRNFYLAPLGWRIEAQGNAQTQELASQICSWVTDANHFFLEKLPIKPGEFSSLWSPQVYLKLIDETAEPPPPPADWPPDSWKVLVVASHSPLPEIVDPAWDACITIADNPEPTRLPLARQGWLSIPEVTTLCTAVDIQARSSHLARIEAAIEKPPPPANKISVVICTYRRGELLDKTIRSVAQQTFDQEAYELIVVNNDPLDSSVDELIDKLRQAEFKGRPGRLKLVRCPIRGLSFARNIGISHARGEVISFIDDDAIARPDWLEQTWAAFQEFPQAGVVGGKIILDVPEPRPRWLKPGWDKFLSHFNPPYTQLVAVKSWWEFPWGANWSARRKALLEIGGFRTKYGRKGKDFGGGEELVAAVLIQRLGYEIVIAPSSEVLHTPDTSRYTFKHVWRTIMAGKKNEYSLQTDLYLPMQLGLVSSLRNILKNLITAVSLRNVPAYQRFEYMMYAWADIKLAGRLGRDFIARFQRPLSLKQ